MDPCAYCGITEGMEYPEETEDGPMHGDCFVDWRDDR